MKEIKYKVNNCNIHLIKTKKFKTTTISINFREKIKKEDITLRRFLFQMLCTTSKKYKTSRLLEIELEDLYSTFITHSTVKFGNVINSYIDFKFLSDKYTDKPLIDDIINLIYEIVLNPNVKNNSFDTNTYNVVKNKLITSIKSKKEDTTKYAYNRALELMDDTDPISYDLWGNLEDLEYINEKALYEYYKHVISTNNIDIFIVGDVSSNIIDKFKDFNIGSVNEIDPFITYKNINSPKGFIENASAEQSKLIIICKILNISLYERRYVLPIYTHILAASSTSRLFTKVREENSLCYTINASTSGTNSIFTIHAGITSNNYQKVLNMVNDELILKKVTNEELDNAKMDITSSLDTVFDSVSNIINYYFGIEVFKTDTYDVKKEIYSKVTKKDIYDLSNKISLACVYLLRGAYEE